MLMTAVGCHGGLLLLLLVHPAGVTLVDLGPAVPKLLHAEALVVGIVAGEVAVGLQPEGVVSAGEEEFLEITHVGWFFEGRVGFI